MNGDLIQNAFTQHHCSLRLSHSSTLGSRVTSLRFSSWFRQNHGPCASKESYIRPPLASLHLHHSGLTISVREFDTIWPFANFYHNCYTLGLQISYSHMYVSHEHEYIFCFFIVQLWKLTEAYRSSKSIVSGDWNGCHVKVTSNQGATVGEIREIHPTRVVVRICLRW